MPSTSSGQGMGCHRLNLFPECSDDFELCKNIMEWGGVGEEKSHV